MNMNQMITKMQGALQSAQTFATDFGHQELKIGQVLLALLEQGDGIARSLFDNTGVGASLLQDAYLSAATEAGDKEADSGSAESGVVERAL
jgi:ATP-dependent Clp protease ATP-binding subunit ClpA